MNKPLIIKANLKLILIFSFFSIFLFGVLSFHMYLRFIEELKFGFNTKIFFTLCLLIVLLLVTSLFTVTFFSNIEINEKEIIIRKLFYKKIIRIVSIKKIILSEVTEFYGVLVDRTLIQLLNNECIHLYSFKYHDFYKVKIILNCIDNVLKNENLKIKNLNLNTKFLKRQSHKIKLTKDSKTFNFSNVLSFSGILFYSFISFNIYHLVTKKNILVYDIFIAISVIVLFLFLHSFNTNYFIISKDYLIVKNTICFWKKTHFKINEIESINIHYHNRQFGKTVLIKTKYFKHIYFKSDNLLKKQWIDFKKEIRAKNITVFDNSNFITQRVNY